ncbi:class I adenylate-forming enzyme family protein [Actinoplanes sp. N902-109]|uniref:class I adenylate-forming enzyme family protein n=1 Tax=Actinoplanes sp. (strain N902-109) TaxID=649831 RepID=UPI00059FFEA1|nr:class I adenylate-forming enzyme family protein [Actinoplanes sp. N902-109]
MRPYLWDPWSTAATVPDRTAVVAGDEVCTFAELAGRADACAHGLHAAGLRPGAVVSTDIPAGPDFFALVLAALKHGFGLFPIGPHLLGIPMGATLLAEAGVTLHVTAGPQTPPYPYPTAPVVSWTDLIDAAGRAAPPAEPPAAGHLVYATSGTTGLPKAVVRKRPRRAYKGVAVSERYGAGLTHGPHIMANPTYHLGTLGPALYALQAGSAVVVQRDWSPAAFADLAERHAADSVMFSPDRLLDVVEARVAVERRFTVVFHGGAACPPAVKRAAIDLFGPVLLEYYGTSESVATEITTAEWLDRPGSVGRPLPGIGVDVVRDGRPVPPGELGEIRLRLRPADHDGGGSVDTGDIGSVDPAGYLFIAGRAGSSPDLLTARLENDIRGMTGVTDAAVLGGPSPACFVEHSRDTDPARLTDAITMTAAMLELPPVRIVLTASGSLPRTPSGKIARAEVSR